ncbi:MAG TPA: response regulator [Opitutaceae bacterium]|nr:response regulator [Opitutaceae bacterium]
MNDEEDGLFLLERAVIREFPACRVWKSRTAAEALDFLATAAVDAVITDNRMPSMEGVVMVRLIRARDTRTPILMLTGSDQVRAAAFEAGVTAFSAAGSWDDIRTQIRALLENPASEQPSALRSQVID